MLLKLLAKLPLGLLYIFAHLIYLVLYYLVRYRRAVVAENLIKAFPEYSDQKRKQIEKAFYRNLADTSVEVIKAANMTEEDLKHRVNHINVEVLDPFIKAEQSFILLSAHSCNWEWLLLSISVKLPIPMDAVYKPLHDKDVDKDMFATRSKFGVDPIDMASFAKEVIKRKGTQRAYCILADQRPGSSGKSYKTTFLNQETKFFVGPEKIAQFVKIPVVFVHMTRTKQGYYQVEFEVLAEPPYERQAEEFSITQRYVDVLEKQIRAYPESWLWSHRRWRKRRQEKR